jgi:hypothetical protein
MRQVKVLTFYFVCNVRFKFKLGLSEAEIKLCFDLILIQAEVTWHDHYLIMTLK